MPQFEIKSGQSILKEEVEKTMIQPRMQNVIQYNVDI